MHTFFVSKYTSQIFQSLIKIHFNYLLKSICFPKYLKFDLFPNKYFVMKSILNVLKHINKF